MTLWVHAYCGYPSYAAVGADWSRGDWDAFTVVAAIKGKPIKGFAKLKTVTGTSLTVETGREGAAFQLFGTWAAARLKALDLADGKLVPIPASDCVALGTDKKGLKIARAVASRSANFEVGPWLHWQEAMKKSAEGGTRNKDVLLKNLRFASDQAPAHVVLIDDVVTTGGHLLAAAEGLRSFGHTVDHAICVANTVNTPPKAGMFNISPWDLEEDPFAGW